MRCDIDVNILPPTAAPRTREVRELAAASFKRLSDWNDDVAMNSLARKLELKCVFNGDPEMRRTSSDHRFI